MQRNTAPVFMIRIMSVALLILFLLPGQAQAAPSAPPTFTVNSQADDAAGGDLANGVCQTTPGNTVCTLRAALQKADAYPGGGVTIVLPAGTYPRWSIYPPISATVTLQGAGSGKTFVDASGLDVGFSANAQGNLLIKGVTIEHAGVSAGILNDGKLTLQDSQIVDGLVNGVLNDGDMTVLYSSILRNNGLTGGGVFAESGTLTLVDSLVAYNHAVDNGGAFFIESTGLAPNTVTIVNSTISNNSSSGLSGGLDIADDHAVVKLFNSTLAGNVVDPSAGFSAPYGAGILNMIGATLQLQNTLVADNFALTSIDDCDGALKTLGENWMDSTYGCAITGAIASVGDPLLDVLRNNGGPTLTRALLPGSPALDQIPLAQCTDQLGAPLTTDQRGAARPLNGLCDIGAYEGSLSSGLYWRNLIRNGDAEASAGSLSGAEIEFPTWTVTGGEPTGIQYNAPNGFPTSTDPGPADRGQNFFAGGYASYSSMEESFDLTPIATAVDTGTVRFSLSGFLGGYADQPDSAQIQLIFLKGSTVLGSTFVAGPTTLAERNNLTQLIFKEVHATIPPTARTATVQISMTCGCTGTFNDGYVDDASLVLTPLAVYLPLVVH